MTDQILLAVATALAARNAAQVRLDDATAALESARSQAEAATVAARRFEEAEREADARYARQFEAAIAAGGTPPVPYFDATDVTEQRRAEIAARGASEAVARFTKAHSSAAAALGEAEAHLLEVQRRAIAGRVDELTTELLELRSRELEIVGLISALGHGELGGVPLSADATSAVSYPPARPTADNLIGSGAVADLNSPICGRLGVFERAHTYWRQFVAQLEECATEHAIPHQEAA